MSRLRARLLKWYGDDARDLPWRRTQDPYRIWVSEVMLQQTRVATVVPYFERFVARFPTVEALAAAPEQELLALWSGLGYYSRARNMQRAAREMGGSFPAAYAGIRELSGIGDYTAAAIASIAFGLPHAVVDGNVMRVLSRLENDPSDITSSEVRRRFQALADELLDAEDPGRFNQAVMELGATVCLPRNPQCLMCPVEADCIARAAGRQNELPVKSPRAATVELERTVYVIERRAKVLMRQRAPSERLMPGFWELPEATDLPAVQDSEELGTFGHSITHHRFRFLVLRAQVGRAPRGWRWLTVEQRAGLPLTTIARKALRLIE